MKVNEAVKYELSGDGVGLKRYFESGKGKTKSLTWYHVHSDEMNKLERWIHKTLERLSLLSLNQ